MKRSALVIYIVMIIVGIVGLFFYVNKSQSPKPLRVRQQENIRQETIAVAVARRDLEASSVLQSGDFQIKNVSVGAGSADVQFNITNTNPVNWALKSPVSANAYIPPASLIAPGSDEYMAMFLQPGNVLYTFELESSDNYLLTNLKPGQGVDIYLSYSLRTGVDGTNEIVSPAHSIHNSRLKPLMVNRRVLAIRLAQIMMKNGIAVSEAGSQLIVELQDNEVKMLKGLEGKAKILLFPTIQGVSVDKTETVVLPHTEASWPVSNDVIFNELRPAAVATTEVNELRG